MIKNIPNEHISAELTISIGADGAIKLSGDKLDEMDKRYYEGGEQIYLSNDIECLRIESYRGNKSGDWENITPKWTEYSKVLAEGKLPEEFEQLLKGDDGMNTTVTSNMENNNNEEVVKESGINSESLGEIFGTSTADDENTDDRQEDLSVINTDISTLTEGDGLKKMIEKSRHTLTTEEGKKAVEAMSKAISSNMPAVSVDEDTEKMKLKKLMEDPRYRSTRNEDGSFTIAMSQIGGHRYEVRVAGEMNSSTFTTTVNVWLVHIYKNSENASDYYSIATRSIRQGGTALINLITDYSNIFSPAEAHYANGRLFVLIMKNQLNMQVLNPSYSYSETMKWFREYIVNGIRERHEHSDDRSFWHPEIYLEEVAYGPRSGKKGKQIVIGIWDSEFRRIYKSLVDDGLAINDSSFLKQGKQLHDLLPDAGRGGGQHMPGSPTSERYGQPSTARIQRFRFDKELSRELWESECMFRMIDKRTYCC